MRIAVLSDSHDNLVKLRKAIDIISRSDVDLTIHLGDIISPFSLKELAKLESEIIVIYGNNDGDKMQLANIAREKGITVIEPPYEMELKNKKIFLMHGWKSKTFTRSIAEHIASTGKYNVVMYGHTHEVDVRKIMNGKVLLLNPGEVFGMLSGKSTIALLELETLEVQVIKL